MTGRMTSDQRFTTNQVVQKTGASLRQLQWWDERGLVRPRLEGHRRVYTLRDLAEIRLITCLRRKTVSLHKIRRALSHLRKQANTDAFEGKAYLLADATLRVIYIESDTTTICELLDKSPTPMLMVRISAPSGVEAVGVAVRGE